MLYYLSLPFLSILLIALQSTVTDIIFSGRLVFELSLIVIIYAGFHLDLIRGAILAFVFGFVWDCVGGSVPGLYTFIYILIFLFSFFVSDWLDTGKIYVIACFCFLCSFLKEIILFLFYFLAFKIDVLMNTYFVVIFLQALILGLFAPVFFYLTDRAEAFFYGKKA
ncbi:MAG: rod shape-determining protein MreD [Deltaproteobacteria bacterium HGW-Deltaproteobacteria-13]|jgi:rod shape-determining protein MreD|nr:MAG: rod shape-determining protein MreD [Deltaproteobacteria bacterium HGW-Deltaproteobacteria-13]